MMLTHKRLTILKFTISSILVVVLFFRVQDDFNEFIANFSQLDLFLYFLSLCVSAVAVLIRSYKWQLLLEVQGAKFSLLTLQAINYMALFFNNFFLGALGGDAFRFLKTMNEGENKTSSISSIIMDRLTGLIMLSIIVIVSCMINYYSNLFFLGLSQLYFIVFCGIVFILLCIVFLYFVPNLQKVKWLSRIILKFKKVDTFLSNFYESIKIYAYAKKIVIKALILSLLFQVTTIISMYLFSLAAGVKVDFFHWAFIVPLVSFIIMIPISANGIGLQEGVFFLYLKAIGIESSSALVVALLPRTGMIIFSLIGGIIYLEQIGWKRRSKAERKPVP